MRLGNYTTAKGVWNGWYYRSIGLTILAVLVLQVFAQYVLKYPVAVSVPLAIVVVAYLIVPRIRERRLGNALVGVVITFVIDVILELVLPMPAGVHKYAFNELLQSNGMALVMGLVLAYFYLKLTQWSEKKREQMEQKRAAEAGPPVKPPVRHHRKKKKKR